MEKTRWPYRQSRLKKESTDRPLRPILSGKLLTLTGKAFLNFQVPEELLSRIDDFRFEHRKSSRAEAVRELIEKGLRLIELERKVEEKKEADQGEPPVAGE